MVEHPNPRLRRLGGYREAPPPRGLESAVRATWRYVRPSPDGPPIPGAGHRVLPETGVSLCYHGRRAVDGAVLEADLLLMGPIEAVRFFAPQPGVHLEAVRLDAELCRDVLGVAPEEHVDALTPAQEAAPRIADRLLPRLGRTRSSGEALALLLDEVGRRAGERRQGADVRLARAALERLRGPGSGGRKVATVARGLGVSERHLRRIVRATTGTSPKRFQRVERLNRLVAAADATARPEWSRLAAALGYADQPHLVQEVRALSGLTPTRLHAERRAQA